ncbi:MAG: NAD-dependent epimerase/dehydratase family protein [Armatimonadetes bacterium]|nr:NAD-dependent epimerase/dehydratase family protein [Armatimonadota bacterium]
MKALVTGGGGFLGKAIVRQLREEGHEVTVLARGRYRDIEALGARSVRCDLRDRIGVARACDGHDCVFHAAARAGVWGDYNDYHETNVDGTRHVVEACLQVGVPRLVYTSTPSVVFEGRDILGGDESLPYASRFLNAYSQTKAAAEKLALAAASERLLVTALRPHLIWGPGDPHLIPRVIDRARTGRLVQVGNGGNQVDMTYIDDAARAHLLAAGALAPGSPLVGRAYFISQGHPVLLWPWIDNLLRRLGIPEIKRSLPLWAARWVGAAMEWAYELLNLRGEPRLTRFVAAQLGTSHYFDIGAARRDFGYEPRVTPEEGLERVLGWLAGKPDRVGTA